MFAFTFSFGHHAQAAGLFISFARTKETKQRKFAGSRSEAKIFTFFLKKKNSLTLKQLFVLHGNPPDFLYAPPLNAGPPTEDSNALRCLRCTILV